MSNDPETTDSQVINGQALIYQGPGTWDAPNHADGFVPVVSLRLPWFSFSDQENVAA